LINCFLERLGKLLRLATESLSIKIKGRSRNDSPTRTSIPIRNSISERSSRGQTALFWKNHFSTIGDIGMNEACLNFLDTDIGSGKGRFFAFKAMDFIHGMISEI